MANINRGSCVYILRAAAKGVTPVYCGKPCGYVMVRDDDRQMRRKYDAFCPQHRAKVNAEAAHED